MPAVTSQQIEASIKSEHYHTAFDGRVGGLETGNYSGREKPEPNDADLAPLKKVTFCTIIDKSGFVFTGVNNGPVIPGDFDAELGRQYARNNALDAMWVAYGYAAHLRLNSEVQQHDQA